MLAAKEADKISNLLKKQEKKDRYSKEYKK